MLEGLKLAKFQTEKPQELDLDLREDRFVKTEASAFLDRNRSTFLNRLALLGVSFAAPLPAGQDQENPPTAPRAEPYKTHLAYVKERRSDVDGQAILDEALEALRGRGLIR